MSGPIPAPKRAYGQSGRLTNGWGFRNFAQIARLAGYKVLATSSPSKIHVATSAGATAVLSYKLSPEEHIAGVKKTTGGKFGHVFDASAAAHELSVKTLLEASTVDKKWFITVDDW